MFVLALRGFGREVIEDFRWVADLEEWQLDSPKLYLNLESVHAGCTEEKV